MEILSSHGAPSPAWEGQERFSGGDGVSDEF